MGCFRSSLAVALLGGATFFAGVESADAWQCSARSRVGWGWGSGPSRAIAAEIALRQCAIHTPRGLMCRIRRCVR